MKTEKDPIAHSWLARLSWQTLEGEARQVDITGAVVVIGRSSEADIQIVDTRLSRKHAEIRATGQGFLVCNLGSVNGVFVNEKRVQETQLLQHGDRIRTGPVTFTIEFPAPPVETSTPDAYQTIVMEEPVSSPHLEVSTGSQRGERFILGKETLTIGRPAPNQQFDIILNDRAVSRPHARIECSATGYLLTDLGSANGTLVNNQPIGAPTLLKDGDSVVFGEAVLIFHTGGN